MKPIPEDVSAFTKRILHGLALEWDIIERSLRKEYRGFMKKPGFELRDLQRLWAMWDGSLKMIIVSRRLVQECPWKTVREVLLHEIAHQFTDEVLGGDHVPHGNTFKRACAILNADPAASGSLPSLYERPAEGEYDDNDRIMLRVRKLLSMAQSNSRNEAEVAMAKAHDYIAKYNIDLLESAKQMSYCSMCIGAPARRQPRDGYAISALLRDYYYVETVYVPMFVLEVSAMGKILEISGTVENVKMADYVYGFLVRVIDEQWAAFSVGKRTGRAQKTDFALGLIKGFREKLDARPKVSTECNIRRVSLVKTEDARLRAYIRERYSSLRGICRRGRRVDAVAHDAGFKAGLATILHKPVDSRSGRAIHQLEGRN